MTEILCFVLGTLFGAFVVYLLSNKRVKEKEKELDEEKNKFQRINTQVTNFLNYNGTSFGQEDVD